MMKRWNDLFQYLVVKHTDMVVKKEENGKFLRNKYEFGSKVERPGYSDAYWNKVLKETGSKYIMEENK